MNALKILSIDKAFFLPQIIWIHNYILHQFKLKKLEGQGDSLGLLGSYLYYQIEGSFD